VTILYGIREPSCTKGYIQVRLPVVFARFVTEHWYVNVIINLSNIFYILFKLYFINIISSVLTICQNTYHHKMCLFIVYLL